MKFKCIDEKLRDFSSVFDLLLVRGFNPEFINKDDGLVSISYSPKLSLFEALKSSKYGVLPSFIFHYREKHKRKNPCFIGTKEFVKCFRWIVITPSVNEFTDYDLSFKMDFWTYSARSLTFLYDLLTRKKLNRKTFPAMLRGITADEFQFSTPYKVTDYYFDSKNGGWLEISHDGGVFYIAEHIIGYTRHTFVSIED
jgi:hypothetical protein